MGIVKAYCLQALYAARNGKQRRTRETAEASTCSRYVCKTAAVLCVAHLDLMVQAHALQGAADVAQLTHKVALLCPPVGNLTLQAAAYHLFLVQRWLGPSCVMQP